MWFVSAGLIAAAIRSGVEIAAQFDEGNRTGPGVRRLLAIALGAIFLSSATGGRAGSSSDSEPRARPQHHSLKKAKLMTLSRFPRTAAAVALVAMVGLAAACGSLRRARTRPQRRPTPHRHRSKSDGELPRCLGALSTVDGPTNTDAVVPSGYTQSPQGAVIAAIQGQARLALAPDNTWAQTAQVVAAPGAGRDAFLRRASDGLHHRGSRSGPDSSVRRVPFLRLLPGRRDRLAGDADARRDPVCLPTRLVWQGEDWKVELPSPSNEAADDPTPTDPTPLTSLDDYVAFSAAN